MQVAKVRRQQGFSHSLFLHHLRAAVLIDHQRHATIFTDDFFIVFLNFIAEVAGTAAGFHSRDSLPECRFRKAPTRGATDSHETNAAKDSGRRLSRS
jgi:hypothetical protein